MLGPGERIWEVVWRRLLVAIDAHWPVSLVGLGVGLVRTVHRDLVKVGAQAVAVGVGVGEQATLTNEQNENERGRVEEGGSNIQCVSLDSTSCTSLS